MNRSKFRTYDINDVASFNKTSEIYGGLSNMASGYPIVVNDVSILTSEALYQACRYPRHPETQNAIIRQRSPMAANMVSKQAINDTRQDWFSVRISIMKWCLKVKLVQNWDVFSDLLDSTENKPIVEISNIDDYWGCKLRGDKLVGGNVLGRLLMDLREYRRSIDHRTLSGINPPGIVDFKLLGNNVGFVLRKDSDFLQRKLF